MSRVMESWRRDRMASYHIPTSNMLVGEGGPKNLFEYEDGMKMVRPPSSGATAAQHDS